MPVGESAEDLEGVLGFGEVPVIEDEAKGLHGVGISRWERGEVG